MLVRFEHGFLYFFSSYSSSVLPPPPPPPSPSSSPLSPVFFCSSFFATSVSLSAYLASSSFFHFSSSKRCRPPLDQWLVRTDGFYITVACILINFPRAEWMGGKKRYTERKGSCGCLLSTSFFSRPTFRVYRSRVEVPSHAQLLDRAPRWSLRFQFDLWHNDELVLGNVENTQLCDESGREPLSKKNRFSRRATRRRSNSDTRVYARTCTLLVETQFVNGDAWFCPTNRIPFRCTRDEAKHRQPGTHLGTLARLSSLPPRTSVSSRFSFSPSSLPLFSLPPRSSPGLRLARAHASSPSN